LDEGATLNMELTVDIGKGYQPSQANGPADAPIGWPGANGPRASAAAPSDAAT